MSSAPAELRTRRCVSCTWHTPGSAKPPCAGHQASAASAKTDTDVFPKVIKYLFHLPLKLVTGFPGGQDVVLSLQRGEIDGRCGWSWSSIKLAKPDWLSGGKLNFVVQMALTPEISQLAKRYEIRELEQAVRHNGSEPSL